MTRYEQGSLLDLLPADEHLIAAREMPVHGDTDWWEGGRRHVRKWMRVWWVWDCSCGQSTKPGFLFSSAQSAVERGEAHAAGEF